MLGKPHFTAATLTLSSIPFYDLSPHCPPQPCPYLTRHLEIIFNPSRLGRETEGNHAAERGGLEGDGYCCIGAGYEEVNYHLTREEVAVKIIEKSFLPRDATECLFGADCLVCPSRASYRGVVHPPG